MLKNNLTQLEMFQTYDQDASRNKDSLTADPLHISIRAYQKKIFSLIVLMCISLASYSLGVEKGKKIIAIADPRSINQDSASPYRAADNDAATVKKELPWPDGSGGNKDVSASFAKKLTPGDYSVNRKYVEAPKGVQAILKEAPKNGSYTIQVASISQSKNVKKELSNLKNKGFSAFSLLKGKYTVICVGRFNDRKEAKGRLEKLKSSYPDCQVRRL